MQLATQCYVTRGDMRNEKKSLTLSLTKPTQNAEAILKTYGEFYITHTAHCRLFNMLMRKWTSYNKVRIIKHNSWKVSPYTPWRRHSGAETCGSGSFHELRSMICNLLYSTQCICWSMYWLTSLFMKTYITNSFCNNALQERHMRTAFVY